MTEVRLVEPAAWRARVASALAEGYTFFDWLGATDDIGRADTLSITLSLCDLAGPRWVWLRTAVPRDGGTLDTVGDLVPGAGWHEREAAELLGATFAGGDPRRLLLGRNFVGTPLRKDEVLAARVAEPWPGAKEPGESDTGAGASPSRRRMVPPGVPEPSVWGDRADNGPAEAAEVAASAQGGRVRRRR